MKSPGCGAGQAGIQGLTAGRDHFRACRWSQAASPERFILARLPELPLRPCSEKHKMFLSQRLYTCGKAFCRTPGAGSSWWQDRGLVGT